MRAGRSIFILVLVVTVIGFMDTHMLLPITALYSRELGASPAMVGMIIGVYSMVNTPFNILVGRLVDRTGPRLPLVLGLAWEGANMLLYSFCRVPGQLLLVRAAHGASGGMVGPSTMLLLGEYAPSSGRGRTMGYYGIALGLAVLLGYPLSGIIVKQFDIRAVFYAGFAFLMLGFVFGLLIAFAAGGKTKQRTTSVAPGSVIPGFLSLVKRREISSAYFAIFAHYFTFGSIVTLLPIYVQRFGMGVFEFAMLLTIFCLVFIGLQSPSGILSDRVGRRIPLAAGLLLISIGLLSLPFTISFLALSLAMVGYGAGYSLIFPSISALIIDRTADDERGLGSGIFHAMITAGPAVGAPVMGLVGDRLGLEMGLGLTASITILALIVVLVNVPSMATAELSRGRSS